jgi:hypothetical protein
MNNDEVAKRGSLHCKRLNLGKEINHLQLNRPSTLPNELTQSLDLSTGDSFRNRLYGFTIPIQQKPFKINSSPMSPLTLTHCVKQASEEHASPTVKSFQLLFLHEHSVRS